MACSPAVVTSVTATVRSAVKMMSRPKPEVWKTTGSTPPEPSAVPSPADGARLSDAMVVVVSIGRPSPSRGAPISSKVSRFALSPLEQAAATSSRTNARTSNFKAVVLVCIVMNPPGLYIPWTHRRGSRFPARACSLEEVGLCGRKL